jgi:glycerol-3-phosphate acyltransferase PlsX
VVSGAAADVVVTDGFTAGVLLEGIDAALAGQRDAIDAGAVLLGLGGVVVACTSVVAGAADVAGCLAAAVQAVRGGVVPAVSGALAELVRQRRVEAGLDAVAP